MDYNDLLFSRYLDQLEEYELNKEQLSARIIDAITEFKAGEYKYQCEVIDNILEDPFIEDAIRASVSGSNVKMNKIFEGSIEWVIVNFEGEE